jgi:hypothetical protein
MAMTITSDHDRVRFILQRCFDRWAREVEFTGDSEMLAFIEDVETWCECARNTIKPRLKARARKERRTN